MNEWFLFKFTIKGSNKSENQDSFQCLNNNKITSVSLSDGAGSSKLSMLSSNYISNKTIYYIEKLKKINVNEMKYLIYKSRKKMLLKLNKYLKNKNNKFHCTFLNITIENDSNNLIISHIGDGIIIGLSKENKNILLSAPENGKYDNYTYFITEENFDKKLHINKYNIPLEYFVIMSDGISDLIQLNNSNINYDFFNNIAIGIKEELNSLRLKNYSKSKIENIVSRQLTLFFKINNLYEKNDDDKTFIIGINNG